MFQSFFFFLSRQQPWTRSLSPPLSLSLLPIMTSPTYSLSFFSGIFLVLLAFVYATFIIVCRHRRARQLAMDRVWEYGRNNNMMNYINDNGDNGNDRYYREMMNSVRSFKYTARRTDEEAATEAVQECVICLSKVSEGERVKVLPNCMHMFHDGCIDMWLSSHDNCPVCRAPVLAPAPAPSGGAPTSSASVVPVAS